MFIKIALGIYLFISLLYFGHFAMQTNYSPLYRYKYDFTTLNLMGKALLFPYYLFIDGHEGEEEP